MIKPVKEAWFWWLDYIYVARQQVRGIFSREKATAYRNGGGLPIVLIPGVYENWRFMRPLAKALHAEGYDVHTIDGLGYNRGTIEDMAQLAKIYIDSNRLINAVIVAHSKGGLIGKKLLLLYENTPVLAGLVTLHTPFAGSKYAYALPVRSLRIFTPKSKTLLDLTKNDTVNNRIISIYGLFDPHIPGGSNLAGAQNTQLSTYGHFRIMADPSVHDEVISSVRRLQK